MRFTEFLENHISKDKVSFHMPGHKGRRIFDVHGLGDAVDDLVTGDITEIPGADNILEPQGIIRDVMNRYRILYGSEETFISVGGSSLGLMASILAACDGHDISETAIAIARNSHRSVFNGVALAGAKTIYIYPEILAEGLVGSINCNAVEDAFIQAEAKGVRISAIVIPSPNYYGICSPIKKIARVVHEHGAILIVDQAHGAHLRFLEPRLSADIADGESCADIVVESTHKTLASFTQTAIVNVYNKELVDIVESKIKTLQTTSPSYMLMKSLDLNAELMEKYGDDLFESWRMNLDRTYDALEEIGVGCFGNLMHDRSKILIDASIFGLSGDELSTELEDKGIITELDSGNFSMCMTGIGNGKGDYERLVDAITDIKNERAGCTVGSQGETIDDDAHGGIAALMNKKREQNDIPKDWEWKHIDEAAGLIAAESITPYPPGVPLIVAGEVMDEESLLWAKEFKEKGGKILGITENFTVKACKNSI